MNIPELIKRAHENAVRKGFYDCLICSGQGGFQTDMNKYGDTCPDCRGTGKTAKLNVYNDIKKECEEFIKSIRTDEFHKDSEQSELADIILIILAYCEETGIDIEKAVIEKLNYNDIR